MTITRAPHTGLAATLALALGACAGEAVEAPLPALGVADDAVTISGVSAGGYMAVQYQVAYSASVSGAAILAGGPWYCARGDLGAALAACMKGPRAEIPAEALSAAARGAAERNEIDPVENLAADRIWIFHGRLDAIMDRGVTEALVDFYAAFVSEGSIELVDDVPAAHLFPTVGQGGRCDAPESPHMGACGYDAAGELLKTLYGELTQPAADAATGELQTFDQRPFRDASGSTGLADTGLLFVPDACRGGGTRCRLHVALHGCQQGAEFVADAFASSAGYNPWAQANDLVVLYPQIRSTLSPLNPNGCWDWWGYEGPDYALRSGAQVAALRAMIEQLQSRPR